MKEDTKISDLTVAEFRTLMQQSLYRDREMGPSREMARRQSAAVGGACTESQALAFMQLRSNGAAFARQP